MPTRRRKRLPCPPGEIHVSPPRVVLYIPDPLPTFTSAKNWKRFFLAVRATVGRHTPKLLRDWDGAAALLFQQTRRDEPWHDRPHGATVRELFDLLCTILEDPEAAKASRFLAKDREMYERTKEILRHCRDIRRRCGLRARYEPLNAPWSRMGRDKGATGEPAWPGEMVRTDKPDFYRIALREVFGNWRVPDAALKDCVCLWEKPAEAALAVLAEWTELTPETLKKHIYKRRRPPKT